MDEIKTPLPDTETVNEPFDHTQETFEKTTLTEDEKRDASPSPSLDSFLDRPSSATKPPKKGKSHAGLIALIVAVVVVAALAATLVILRSAPGASKDETSYAEIALSVDKNGIHEADVPVDEKGEIRQNGTGSLLSYVPADIAQIDVENAGGSFSVTSETPAGGSTVYKVVGLEDFALQSDIADEIATDAAALSFSKIIAVNGSLRDFGLDKPTASVTVRFHDDTSAVIRVGDNAAGDAGVYIAFGTGDAVYLVASDAVDSFLYSVTSFISREITATVEDTDNAALSRLTITGSHYPEPITIEANTDEAIEATYLVTAPRRMVANATESYDIAGNIRGLYAEAVVCVNPSADQLAEYGLSEPYAAIEAVYPDTTITLQASAPADNGLVNLYHPGKNTIYTIQLAAVSWAKTSVELLMPESILNAKLACVSGIDFTAGDTAFTLDVVSTTRTTTDDDGNEQETTETTATYNGKALPTQDFTIFFQNLSGIRNQGEAENGGDELMRCTVSYSTGRAPDTLTVYTTGTAKYTVALNGDRVGSASKSYIDKLLEGAKALISGDPVESL